MDAERVVGAFDGSTHVFEIGSVTIKSLHCPLFGRAVTSASKAADGVFWKKGEKVKNWKQRCFAMDSASRALFYFKDRKPEEMPQGFVSLWDGSFEAEPSGSASPRLRAARSFLRVVCPFRRVFYLGFSDDSTRDSFRATAMKVRDNGRINDAKSVMEWWAANIDSSADKCPWRVFCDAVAKSYQLTLSEDAQVAARYVLQALQRENARKVPLDFVTLTSVVDFCFMFGNLDDAIQQLDGVLLSLSWCTGTFAERIVSGAKPGTFVLYVASRPTDDCLPVFGLTFVNARGRLVKTHIFRDPVNKFFYTDVTRPCYSVLDHLVAAEIGMRETFARQTNVKIDEMACVRKMVQRSISGLAASSSSIPNSPALSHSGARTAPPAHEPLPPVLDSSKEEVGFISQIAFVSGSSSGDLSNSGTVKPRPSRGAVVGSAPKHAGPVFDEIEKMLLEHDPSSSSSEHRMSPTVLHGEDFNASEMMEKNTFCVICGMEIGDLPKGSVTCQSCAKHVSKDPIVDLLSVADVPITFLRKGSVSVNEEMEILSRESSRKGKMFGAKAAQKK